MTAEHPIEMSDSSFLEWARGQLCGDLKSLKYAKWLMDRRIDAVMQTVHVHLYYPTWADFQEAVRQFDKYGEWEDLDYQIRFAIFLKEENDLRGFSSVQ